MRLIDADMAKAMFPNCRGFQEKIDMVPTTDNIQRSHLNGGWVSVKEAEPRLGCPIVDSQGNKPYIPILGIACVDGEWYVDDGRMIECYAKSNSLEETASLFLKGKETIIDGQKCRILPAKIKYWFDLPEPPDDEKWKRW